MVTEEASLGGLLTTTNAGTLRLLLGLDAYAPSYLDIRSPGDLVSESFALNLPDQCSKLALEDALEASEEVCQLAAD